MAAADNCAASHPGEGACAAVMATGGSSEKAGECTALGSSVCVSLGNLNSCSQDENLESSHHRDPPREPECTEVNGAA